MELPYTQAIIEKVQKVISETKLENIESYGGDFQRGYEVCKEQVEKNVADMKADMLK